MRATASSCASGSSRPPRSRICAHSSRTSSPGVIEHASRPDAGPELTLGDGHRLQFSSNTVIQWEWAQGSREVRLIEPFTHLHPRFDALWTDPRFVEPMRDMLGTDRRRTVHLQAESQASARGLALPMASGLFVLVRVHARDRARDRHGDPVSRRRRAAQRRDTRSAGLARSRPGPARSEPTRPASSPTRARSTRPTNMSSRCRRARCCCFPSLLVHRSTANTSDRQRRAILLSFQPAGRPRQRDLEWQPQRVEELP